ncbi:MAG: hypothetical protein WA633_23100 [Stellaceae bacterium]
MDQQRGFLTPEERARIVELEDLLIHRFVEYRVAEAAGATWRAKNLEAEIDTLLKKKEQIERWATLGSA